MIGKRSFSNFSDEALPIMTTFSGSEPAAPAGTIEFPCTGCGRTLKVPAAAAGKRASCPQCNTIATVPLQAPVAATLAPSISPQAPSVAGDGNNAPFLAQSA